MALKKMLINFINLQSRLILSSSFCVYSFYKSKPTNNKLAKLFKKRGEIFSVSGKIKIL